MELRLISIEYISCPRRANLSYSQHKCMIGKTMLYSFKKYIECLFYTSTKQDLRVIYEYTASLHTVLTPFNMFLNSMYLHFIKDFYIYIYQKYWLTVFSLDPHLVLVSR